MHVALLILCVSATLAFRPGSKEYKKFKIKEDEKRFGLPKDPLPTKLQACCACRHYMKQDVDDCVATRTALFNVPDKFECTGSSFECTKRRREQSRARHIGNVMAQHAGQKSEHSYWGDLSGFFRRRLAAALTPVLYKDGISREREESLLHSCYNNMKCTAGHCPDQGEESQSFLNRDGSIRTDSTRFCWAPLPFMSPIVWGHDCSDLEVYPQCDQLKEDRWPQLSATLEAEGDAEEADEYDVKLCCVLHTCDPIKNNCPMNSKQGAGSELAGNFVVQPTPSPPTPSPTPKPFVSKDAEKRHKLAAYDLQNMHRFEERRTKKQTSMLKNNKKIQDERSHKAALKAAHALAIQRFNKKVTTWRKDKSTWSNKQWEHYCTYYPQDMDCTANDDDAGFKSAQANKDKTADEVKKAAALELEQKKARDRESAAYVERMHHEKVAEMSSESDNKREVKVSEATAKQQVKDAKAAIVEHKEDTTHYSRMQKMLMTYREHKAKKTGRTKHKQQVRRQKMASRHAHEAASSTNKIEKGEAGEAFGDNW
jgi:hypothetical protein